MSTFKLAREKLLGKSLNKKNQMLIQTKETGSRWAHQILKNISDNAAAKKKFQEKYKILVETSLKLNVGCLLNKER